MNAFPLWFFSVLIRGALVMSALGGIVLLALFVRDAVNRRIW